MALEVYKTWIAEILKYADLNGAFNHFLTYIKQNKDRILGDNAESTGVTAHDHEGTYGVVLGTDALEDSAITTAKINNLAVTTGKLAADAVTAAKLADDAVVTANIVDANVTTVKIADLNVTTGKLAADAVTAAKLADDAVVTANIVDANVTAAKLATDSVQTAKIVDLNVTTGKLAVDAVTNAKLADDAVQTENIVDVNVTTAKIADLNVTTGKLAADAVTAAKLADDAVVTANIVDANVTTVKIADLNVTTGKLAADAVTAAKLADDAVVTANIVDLNVTTGKLAADAVTAAKLADDAVVTANIVDANVTWAKLAAATQRYILSERVTHAELIWISNDTIWVQFPWTEPGGTAWTSTSAIDVSQNVGSGGNVKVGVTANEASKWYYLYMSNSYTIAQPVASEFIFTQSPDGESGYILVGAIYNNSSQNIEPFDQYGRFVKWQNPIKVLNAGTAATYTAIDCSSAVPDFDAALNLIKITGMVVGTADAGGNASVTCYVIRNGVTSTDDNGHLFAYNSSYSNASIIAINGNQDILADINQIIDYKVANVNASNVAATIYVSGYYVR